MNAYIKTTWVNGGAPPINAPNLNKIEEGAEAATEAITMLEKSKLDNAPASVKAEHIAIAAVTRTKIAADSVVTNHITDGAVTEDKICDKSVSIEKLSSDLQTELERLENGNRLLGSREKSGTYTYAFKIEAVKTYKLTNTSASSSITMYTKDTTNGENKETVTGGMTPGRSKLFTATQDAAYIRGYMNLAAGSFELSEYAVVSKENLTADLQAELDGKLNASVIETKQG